MEGALDHRGGTGRGSRTPVNKHRVSSRHYRCSATCGWFFCFYCDGTSERAALLGMPCRPPPPHTHTAHTCPIHSSFLVTSNFRGSIFLDNPSPLKHKNSAVLDISPSFIDHSVVCNLAPPLGDVHTSPSRQ